MNDWDSVIAFDDAPVATADPWASVIEFDQPPAAPKEQGYQPFTFPEPPPPEWTEADAEKAYQAAAPLALDRIPMARKVGSTDYSPLTPQVRSMIKEQWATATPEQRKSFSGMLRIDAERQQAAKEAERLGLSPEDYAVFQQDRSQENVGVAGRFLGLGVLDAAVTVRNAALGRTGLVDADEANRLMAQQTRIRAALDRKSATAGVIGESATELIGDVGQSLTGSIGAGLAGGPAAAIGFAVTQSVDKAYTQAKDAGLPAERALPYALTAGAVEGFVTYLFGKAGAKLGVRTVEEITSKPAVRQAASKWTERIMGKLGMEQFAATALEGAEESSITALQKLNDFAYGADPRAGETFWRDVLKAGVGGALAGGAVNAPSGLQDVWDRMRKSADATANAIRDAETFAAENPDKVKDFFDEPPVGPEPESESQPQPEQPSEPGPGPAQPQEPSPDPEQPPPREGPTTQQQPPTPTPAAPPALPPLPKPISRRDFARLTGKAAKDEEYRTTFIEALRDVQPPPTEQPVEAEGTLGLSDAPVTSVPVSELKIDPERFQFKGNITTEGVVEGDRLQGKYDPLAGGNLIVWEDTKGDRYVVNGHHRFDLARRKGVKQVNAQILKESDGITPAQAKAIGAKLNILDEKGTVDDYITFFKETDIPEASAVNEGLLARSKGKTGFLVGRFATDSTLAAYRNKSISADKAAIIADEGRGDEGFQLVGLQKAKSLNADQLRSSLRALKLFPRGASSSQQDLFGGFDDTAIVEAEAMGKAAEAIITDLKDRVLAVRGALKRPDKAREMGLSGDLPTIQAEVNRLNEQIDTWSRWTTDRELVRQVREKAGLPTEAEPEAPAPQQAEPFTLEQQPAAQPRPASFENTTTQQPDLIEDLWRGSLPGQQGMFDGDETYSAAAADDRFRKGDDHTSAPADPQGQFAHKLRSLPLPEMVELARNLLHAYPNVKALQKALGQFVTKKGSSTARIDITPDLAQDPDALARVLAHEMGHLADWLPNKSLARGNILGRIGSLQKYVADYMAGRPGGPGPLDAADKERLRKIAEQMASMDAPTLVRTIEREITESMPITPQDVLDIWNSVDQTKLNPDLLAHVKGMSTAEKLSIVKEAMKGVVPEELQKFARQRYVGLDKSTTSYQEPPTKKEINRRWQGLIEDEIRKRALLSNETIRNELIALTKWWSGDYQDASPEHKKYRESSHELYAEALSVFFNSPGDLAQRAPEFYKGFSAYIDRKPEVFAEYMRLQDVLNGTPEDVADRRQYRVYDMFDRGAEKLRAARESEADNRTNPRAAVENFLHQYIYDALQPAKSKVGDPKASDAMYILDELYTNDNPNQVFLSRVDRLVSQPLIRAGLDHNELGAYLFFNRIASGDRSELINPLGHTPDTARQQLDRMKEKMGRSQFAQLQSSANEFYDLVFDVGVNANAAGLWTPEQQQKLVDNHQSYAAFWITDYIDSSYISPRMRKQIGTFKETANPFTNTLMKMMALNRLIGLTEAKRALVTEMKHSFPKEIRAVELGYRTWDPPKPADVGTEYLHHFERGKHVVYQVPEAVAKSFKHHDIGGLQRIAGIINSVVYKVFHPLYVTASAGFTISNPFRDIARTWKNLSAIAVSQGKAPPTLREILRTVVKNFDVAWARARRRADPKIEQLLEDRVFGAHFVDVMGEEAGGEYERMLKERGFLEQYSQNRAIRYAQKAMAALEAVGTFQETAVKAAANEILASRGVPVKERSYLVRKYAGTPDFYQRGHATTLMQSVLMYSRVKINGLVTDAQIATGKKTAAAWWWRTMLANIAPTTLTRLAAYGVFGPTLAAMFSNASRGLMSSYILIPLGLLGDDDEEKDKTLFLSIPQDDTGKTVAAIWGSLMDAVAESSGAETPYSSGGAALQDAFGHLTSGVIPSVNPMFTIGQRWLEYGRGENPVDPFRNEPIVPRTEWEAGGMAAARKMMAWTADQFGVLSDVLGYPIDKVLGTPYTSDDQGTVEMLLKNIPGISRLLRVTSAGDSESEWGALDEQTQEAAQFRLSLPREARDLTQERYLLSRNKTRTVDENRRYDIVNEWYRDDYSDSIELIKEYDAGGDSKLADAEREKLRRASLAARQKLRSAP